MPAIMLFLGKYWKVILFAVVVAGAVGYIEVQKLELKSARADLATAKANLQTSQANEKTLSSANASDAKAASDCSAGVEQLKKDNAAADAARAASTAAAVAQAAADAKSSQQAIDKRKLMPTTGNVCADADSMFNDYIKGHQQ